MSVMVLTILGSMYLQELVNVSLVMVEELIQLQAVNMQAK